MAELLYWRLLAESFSRYSLPNFRIGKEKVENIAAFWKHANNTMLNACIVQSGGFILERSTKEKREGRNLLRIECQEQAWKLPTG